MSFSLIKFEGKALEKLLDAVCKGIGDLKRPWQMKREADAKAYEFKVLEKAKVESAIFARESEQDFTERMETRLLQKELKRQRNIELTVAEASEQLKDDSSATEQPVSESWAVRFFDIVQDISDDELRILWSKILAGEVKQPNSFSLRTLEALRNMSVEEASIFSRAVQLSLNDNKNRFLPNMDMERLGLSFADEMLLDDLGLYNRHYVSMEYNVLEKKGFRLTHGQKSTIVKVKGNIPTIKIYVRCFTKTGLELAKLIAADIKENPEYIKAVHDWILTNSNVTNVEVS
jgi:hypothetical protein